MRIIYMGSPEFALFGLNALAQSHHVIVGVVTREDKIKGRKKLPLPTVVKTRSEELGLKVFTPKNPNEGEFLEEIKKLNADIIVVSAYGKILKSEILAMPKYGVMNIHGSLLPLYRGASPINSAIKNGDTKTGITIMYLDEGMDEGDICLKKTLEIGENENFDSLRDRMGALGGEMLIEALELIEKGSAPRIRQRKDAATYCNLMTRDDELINWQQNLGEIHNHIRSISPNPGAFTYFGKEPIKILETTKEFAEYTGKPGEFLGAQKNQGVQIGANGGYLWLITVKPAGKKAMKALDWYRGLRNTENIKFTNEPIE